MAALLLSAVGGAAGGALFGAGSAVTGAMFGRLAGALAGSAIDGVLFGSKTAVEGPRLSDLNVMGSSENAPIPRVYGRARLAGQVIWATALEEVVTTSKQSTGGKGGPRNSVSSTTYSYFANFAVGLCEGRSRKCCGCGPTASCSISPVCRCASTTATRCRSRMR
jgi:hypothetical protein